MDVVGYTINPQVHAFDNASLTETLAAQAGDGAQRAGHRRRPAAGRRADHPAAAVQSERDRSGTGAGAGRAARRGR